MIGAKLSRKTCEFCSENWNTVVRLFPSEEDFQGSEFYGGGDKLINDPNGVEIAVWPGKNNVNLSQSNWWICAPVHPNCGCMFEEHSFSEREAPKEDWYSSLDFSDLEDDPEK